MVTFMPKRENEMTQFREITQIKNLHYLKNYELEEHLHGRSYRQAIHSSNLLADGEHV